MPFGKLNPFAGYRDPTRSMLDQMGAFGVDPMPEEMPQIMPGLRDAFAPPNPGLNIPAEKPMAQGYAPPNYNTSAMDQYRNALGDQPMQNDYRPSKKRTFGAIALGGLAGMAANNPQMAYGMAHDITRQPYNSAMEEWKTTTSGYKDAATIEDSQNKQDFDRWYKGEQIKSLDSYRDSQIDVRNRGLTQKDEFDDARLQIMRDAANGNLRLEFDASTGNAVMVKKTGPPVPIDPKIIRGLTFEQREMLESMGAIQVVNARGDVQKELDEARAASAAEIERIRGEERRKTDAADPDNKPQTAADIKVQGQNRAGEFQRLHPEWADWVQVDDATQTYRIVRPSNIFTRPPAAEVAKATAAFAEFMRTGQDTAGPGAVPGNNSGSITPGGTPQVTPPRTGPANGPAPRNGPRIRQAAKPGYVWMIAPDGKRGQVKESEVKRLEGLKYTRE